jgi:hypothetical protein
MVDGRCGERIVFEGKNGFENLIRIEKLSVTCGLGSVLGRSELEC